MDAIKMLTKTAKWVAVAIAILGGLVPFGFNFTTFLTATWLINTIAVLGGVGGILLAMEMWK